MAEVNQTPDQGPSSPGPRRVPLGFPVVERYAASSITCHQSGDGSRRTGTGRRPCCDDGCQGCRMGVVVPDRLSLSTRVQGASVESAARPPLTPLPHSCPSFPRLPRSRARHSTSLPAGTTGICRPTLTVFRVFVHGDGRSRSEGAWKPRTAAHTDMNDSASRLEIRSRLPDPHRVGVSGCLREKRGLSRRCPGLSWRNPP